MMKTKVGSVMTVVVLMFVLVHNAVSYPEQYVIRSDNVGSDKWFGTHYYSTGINDEGLRVGGWGDAYFTLIRMPVHFNVPGRKLISGATLYLNSFGSYRPTSMQKYFVLDSWSETSTTDHWELDVSPQGSLPAPTEDGLYAVPIKDEFLAWISGQYQNNGIMLVPENVDNRFNHFLSSENYRVPLRPRIVVNYEKVPDFKMPLPGGKYWKVTTAAGGSSTHQGQNYYAIDFSYRHIDENDDLIENNQDIPILASADGRVLEVGNNSFNGNYVRIDHDKDMKFSTGFQSNYLHMKNNTVMLEEGDLVKTGDVLGIMGNTGEGNGGVHLHFQLYFEHKGSIITEGDNATLNFVLIENSWFISQMAVGSFYESENTPFSF